MKKILTSAILVYSDGSTELVKPPSSPDNRCNIELFEYSFEYHYPGDDGVCIRCGVKR
jgi:hypothetical protein